MGIALGTIIGALLSGNTAITGTGPVLAALLNGVTLSTAVTWGSYSGTGTVTATKQMKLNAGSWVAYVGGTVVNTGELWQVRELCSDDLVTDQPFESIARTVTTAATAPATITAGQWTLDDSPSAGGDTLAYTLTALPNDGGSPITSFEFRRNGGAPTTLSGLGTGLRLITVLATTAANIETRAVNAIGPGAWSDTKSKTPTVSGLYPARFGIGSEQGSGTGAFDTNLYTGTKPANGTYGNFSVTAGVITPNGSQTAGSFTVDNWPVTVASGTVAIATQGQFDAITASSAGKTILVREGAGLSAATSWNSGADFNYATILGDGVVSRPTTIAGLADTSSDSRKHFVSWSTINTKKLIFDNLRFVTGSTAGAKVSAFTMTRSGEGNYVEDIYVLRSYFMCSRADPNGDYTAGHTSYPGGGGISFAGPTRRVSVRDNVISGAVGDPASIAMTTVQEMWEIVGNWVDLHYYDGIRPPGLPGLFGGNIVSRPTSRSTDTNLPHCDGVQYYDTSGPMEASAFIQGDARGYWQSLFASNGTNAVDVRNILVADNALYQISLGSTAGSQINYATWVPRNIGTFPLSNPQGGIRWRGTNIGTNDLLNSVFRASSSIIDATPAITQTGNVDAQSWTSSDWTTAYPNWQMTDIPTLQDALQYHALPNSGGAAAGKGANQNITSWGSERSSYVLNYTTPTVSSITITPTVDGFTGTLRTNVGNNMVYYCVIPQAQGNPTWREIKEKRVANAVGYGNVWCSRANASTDLAISINTASPGVAYKFCAVAENGWSVQSAITTSNFTTATAGITRVGVGAMASSNSTASLDMPIPAGLSNGDYLVAIITHRHLGSEPTTPGWGTKIFDAPGWSANTIATAAFGRVRDGSEGANLTITTAVAARMQGFVVAYRGVSGDGAEASQALLNPTSAATTSLTATANSAIIHIWAQVNNNNTMTLPNPGDLVAEGRTPDNVWYLGVENLLSTSAGATATRTATSATANNWSVGQIELLKA